MSKYIVDTQVVNDAIKELNQLKSTCDKYAKKEKPKANKGKGNTHDELKAVCDNIQSGWKELSKLCAKSVEFLGGEVNVITEGDKKSAKALSK